MCTWVNKEVITIKVSIVSNFIGREGAVIQSSGVLGMFSYLSWVAFRFYVLFQCVLYFIIRKF